MPRLSVFHNDYGPHGFEAIAINLSEDMEAIVKPWARQNTNPYLRDDGSVWAVYRQHSSIPLNYIIDTGGVVRFWQEGYSEALVKQTIEQLLPDPIVHDVGVTQLIAPVLSFDSGATVTPACSVYNFRSSTETYPVRMRIGTGYDQVITVTDHQPGTARYIEFPAWTALTRGQVAVACSVELAGDDIGSNNAKTGAVTVNVYDIAVSAILAPADSVTSGSAVVPAAEIRNFGTMSEYVKVLFSIGGLYLDSVNISLQAGRCDTAFLPSWTPGELGVFSVRCTASGRRGEMVPANNLLTKDIRVWPSSGIEEPAGAKAAFALFDARPNPSAGRTVFQYMLPAAGLVDIKVYSSSGELVRALHAGRQPAGRHQVVWDGRDEPGRPVGRGAYFCRMTAGDFRASRKLTIIE